MAGLKHNGIWAECLGIHESNIKLTLSAGMRFTLSFPSIFLFYWFLSSSFISPSPSLPGALIRTREANGFMEEKQWSVVLHIRCFKINNKPPVWKGRNLWGSRALKWVEDQSRMPRERGWLTSRVTKRPGGFFLFFVSLPTSSRIHTLYCCPGWCLMSSKLGNWAGLILANTWLGDNQGSPGVLVWYSGWE